MAGVKITDLEVLSESASDDLLYIVDVSDNTQSPQGTSKAIEVGNFSKPYKVYSALLTQIGTDAPTAIILENNLSTTLTYEYLQVGIYQIISSVELDYEKVWYSIGGQGSVGARTAPFPMSIEIGLEGTLLIYTFDSSDTFFDEALFNTPIEIRIYN